MNKLFRETPIVTISTSLAGKAAIGIIRITGFKDIESFLEITNLKFKKLKPRYSQFVSLFNDQGGLLDEGILIYYPGPNSYTGEDIIELQLHGNPIQLEIIQRFLIKKFNLETAIGGEFTYRALKNKKLSLSQVEGLDLLLNSSSSIGISTGLSTLHGSLHKSFLDLRSSFLELSSALELSIDFSEDIGEDQAEEKLLRDARGFDSVLQSLVFGCSGKLSALNTPVISLFGRTNAGKSTLFNRILGSDRAIVSDIEGTTRDYISELFYINDNPYRLTDTAGIRETNDKIESIGIDHSFRLMDEAFISIYVLNPFIENTDFIRENLSKFDIVVFTHCDQNGFNKQIEQFSFISNTVKCFQVGQDSSLEELKFSTDSNTESGSIEPVDNNGPMGPESEIGPIEPDSKNGPMGPEAEIGPIEPDSKSGPMGPELELGPIEPVDNNGPMGPLLNLINFKYLDAAKSSFISIDRHREIILELNEIWNLQEFSNNINDLGVISADFVILKSRIEELIGVISPDETLNNIFNNFCIGK